MHVSQDLKEVILVQLQFLGEVLCQICCEDPLNYLESILPVCGLLECLVELALGAQVKVEVVGGVIDVEAILGDIKQIILLLLLLCLLLL